MVTNDSLSKEQQISEMHKNLSDPMVLLRRVTNEDSNAHRHYLTGVRSHRLGSKCRNSAAFNIQLC